MPRLPFRRVLLGFGAGAAAGWLAGLLRTPRTSAVTLPQEDFGEAPVEAGGDVVAEPAPAEPQLEPGPAPAAAEPPDETPAEPGDEAPAEPGDEAPAAAAPAKPARRRRAPKVAEAAADALREGQAVATEHLEEPDIPPPPPAPGPAARRRRSTPEA